MKFDRTFIVAEISANHRHDFDLTVKTVEAAKKAGADAVKVQTFTPDTITIDSDSEYFTINNGSLWDGRTYYDLYQEAYMPWEWQPKLKKIADDLGIIFFSSPFDFTAVDFLETLNVPMYKIASFEITDIPLIKHTASKMKPIIISTGIAQLEEIQEAIEACFEIGNKDIALLKCTSAYPASYKEANLKTIPDMISRFKCTVGVSDHSIGNAVPAAAVTLGAKIIEKHFILDKNIGGPDADFSMEPDEFANMVQIVRNIEKSLGKATYTLSEKAQKNRTFSRSLFAIKDIASGEMLTRDNVRSIRPGNGMHPRHLEKIIGNESKYFIKKGTPLTNDIIFGEK